MTSEEVQQEGIAGEYGDLLQMYRDSGRGRGTRHGNFVQQDHALSLSANLYNNPLEDKKKILSRDWIVVIAEALYVVRPVVYVASMMIFGASSWKPWFLSLFLETFSLRVLKQRCKDPLILDELSRRSMSLSMYLFRSPFFDKFIKKVLVSIFKLLAKLPLLGVIFSNLSQLLVSLQNHYFYTSP
jgi:hypothetical protein